MRVLVVLLILLSVNKADPNTECKAQDKDPKFYRISQNAGDSRPRVTLVGLFPLHQNSPDKMCNKIVSVKNYNGYQRMEAFVLALEKVNNQQFYKSDVFLEAILYDTCSDPLAEYPIAALRHATKLIEDENNMNSKKKNLIIGVVGAAYSSVTKPFAKATLSLNLPLISYAATNRDLSNYKMFARTVWSDDVLAETITDIIYNFELTSLKTLGTSGSDNSKTLMEKINKDKNKKTPQLKTQALKNFSLCDVVEFPKDKNNEGFKEVSKHILDSLVDAYIVALKADTKLPFLDTLKNIQREGSKLSRKLQLISTDTWDISDELTDYTEIADQLINSITIVEDSADEAKIAVRERLQRIVNDFLKGKNPENPWFEEFWKEISNCTILKDCIKKNLADFKIDSKVENVMNTAVLYSKTFKNYKKDKCPNDPNCIFNVFNGQEYFNNYILNTKGLESLFGEKNNKPKINLDCHGDSMPKYAIYQLQTSRLQYEKIGTWTGTGTLTLNSTKTKMLRVQKRGGGRGGTECKPECQGGEKPVFLQRSGSGANVFVDDCCHTCHVLDANEVLEKGKNIKCAAGFWPNKQQTSCQLIWTEEEMVPNYDGASPPVVTVDILCSLFMIIICGYAAFFFIHRDHAAVSKSGVHYFPFIFGGAFLCQVSGLVFLNASLSGPTCSFIQYLSGLAPTIMFTAIVVKTRKVYRIFIHTFQENRTSLVDVGNLDMCPTAIEQYLTKLMAAKTRQIVTIFAMIGIQFIIITIWIIIHDARDEKDLIDVYPNSRHIQICNINLTEFFGVQAYNFIVVIMCTVYGYMTRHVRSDFNETKYISFAMFTVCLVWMSGLFIIVAVMNIGYYDFHSELYEPELHASVFSFMLALSGMGVIAIMFTNKLYLIVKKGSGTNDNAGENK